MHKHCIQFPLSMSVKLVPGLVYTLKVTKLFQETLKQISSMTADALLHGCSRLNGAYRCSRSQNALASTLSHAISWMEIYKFWLRFHRSLFQKIQLTIFHHFFQIMACRRPGDKPLSEPMMASLMTHICATQPQWVRRLEFKMFSP